MKSSRMFCINEIYPEVFGDFAALYWPSTQDTLVGLYARRNSVTGQPEEDINGIIHRVAYANAIAELKYVKTPAQLVDLSLAEALHHPLVLHWAEIFALHIGRQKFWANTPGNINAAPETSLKVLQYWAHGKLAAMEEEEIWLFSEDAACLYESDSKRAGRYEEANASGVGALSRHPDRHPDKYLDKHKKEMCRLAFELRGQGCLAACGVTWVEDSLIGIQEAARVEALAAKAAMGMGLNTSSLRPWSTILNSGARASGPDRFYGLTIASAVEAVAQGGRRGGALIELRNSNHPDILFFLDKKRLVPKPSLEAVFQEVRGALVQHEEETEAEFNQRLWSRVESGFSQAAVEYMKRQEYLRNTNITVLAMPGFMDAVRDKCFYPAAFDGKRWQGPIFDPVCPVIDERTGQQKIDPLTKEPIFAEYKIDTEKFPEALQAAALHEPEAVEREGHYIRVKGCFYAPDVMARIIAGMCTSGEPGLAFYEHVNKANANAHLYDLDTCNPCGEQFLPAGKTRDGRIFLGTCNLASMHAAHLDLWREDGSYNYEIMRQVAAVMQRFMDNVTDVSWYPLAAQNLTARLERRNGGGFAGIAEYLSRLECRFGTAAAYAPISRLYREFTEASVQASIELAAVRGVYPVWPGSRFEKLGLAVRNACLVNNAPTGTLAQALQTSWGVDPHNGIVFSRKVRSRVVDFVAPGFRDLMIKYKAWPASEADQVALMQAIRENAKSCRGIKAVPEAVQDVFPTRLEVTPDQYIRHLGAIHEGAATLPEAFNSVSNTCAIAVNADYASVHNSIMLAYDLGVKDVTFYPDGSRISQPVEPVVQTKEGAATLLLKPDLADRICPICKSTDWVFSDRCLICQGCSYSLCG